MQYDHLKWVVASLLLYSFTSGSILLTFSRIFVRNEYWETLLGWCDVTTEGKEQYYGLNRIWIFSVWGTVENLMKNTYFCCILHDLSENQLHFFGEMGYEKIIWVFEVIYFLCVC